MAVTVQISIPESLVPVLDERATAAGLPRDEYLKSLISRELSASATLDEILGPFRAEVAALGVTDEELEDVFRQARRESGLSDRSRELG